MEKVRYGRTVTMAELMEKILKEIAEYGQTDENANKIESEIRG